MPGLKYLLMSGGFGMIFVAVAVLSYDVYTEILHRRAMATPGVARPSISKTHWRTSIALASLAWGPILLALSLVIGPTGMAGVR